MERKISKEEVTYNRKRTLILLARSIIIATAIAYVWIFTVNWLHPFFGLKNDGQHGSELGSALIMLMPSISFSILQGFILNRVMGQHSKIKAAVDTLNARMFLEERDRRVPKVLHLMLLIIMAAVLFIASLYNYSTKEVGTMVIWIYSFLASLFFFMVVEFDNAFTGISRIEPSKIPDGWMVMTIYDIIEGRVKDYESLRYKKS